METTSSPLARDAFAILGLVLVGCIPEPPGRIQDGVWRIDDPAVVIGADASTGDVFAVLSIDEAPVMARLAAADGAVRWSASLPSAATVNGVRGTLVGSDVAVVAHSDTSFTIDGRELAAGSWLLRWSQESGVLSVTPAPPWWGLAIPGAPANRVLVGLSDGSIASTYGETDDPGQVAVLDPAGRLAWTVVMPADEPYVHVLGPGCDGDVLFAGDYKSGRLRRSDGSVSWTTVNDGAISAITASGNCDVFQTGSVWNFFSGLTIDAYTPFGEPRWRKVWVFSDRDVASGWLSVDLEGRLIASVQHRDPVTYNPIEFPVTGATVAILDPLDGALSSWANFDASYGVGGLPVGGRDGRVYLGGSSLIAIDLP